MSEMKRYTLSEREFHANTLKFIRDEFAQDNRMAGGVGSGWAARLTLALALLDLGVESEDVRDGLLINNRVVIAVNKAKYRHAHNYEWKRYYELPFVVAVAKGERYKKDAANV